MVPPIMDLLQLQLEQELYVDLVMDLDYGT